MATQPPTALSPGGVSVMNPIHPPLDWKRLSDLISDGEFVVDSEEWFPRTVFSIICKSDATLHMSTGKLDSDNPASTPIRPFPFTAGDQWDGRWTRLDVSASDIASNDDIWLGFQS